MAGEVRGIRDGEYAACLDLWDRAFEDTSRHYFEKYFAGDPWFSNNLVRVYTEDGRMLSAAAICRRPVRIGRSVVVMGGIANVGTVPEARRRGLSTQVMQDCIRTMELDDFDFSALYTGIHEFYARLGWVTVPEPFFAGRLKGRIPRREGGYRVRRYRRADVDRICEIYDSYNDGRTLSLVREPAYFQGYVLSRAPLFYVAEDDRGQVVAYIHCGGGTGTLAVHEVGCLPGHEAAVADMMLLAARSALRKKVTNIVAALPEEPEIISALSLIADELERRAADYAMFRIINLARLVQRILPELSLRSDALSGGSQAGLGKARSETELGIKVDDRRVDIRIRPGKVEFAHPGSREVVRMTQQQFFYLLFGYKSGPREIGIEASPQALDVLEVLFPKQPSVYWMLDHF